MCDGTRILLVKSDESSDVTGSSRLHDPALNKSTAFTRAERERFRLRGLLPAGIGTQAVQINRVLGNLRRKASDIERYIFMVALRARNERLFYRTLIEHISNGAKIGDRGWDSPPVPTYRRFSFGWMFR